MANDTIHGNDVFFFKKIMGGNAAIANILN
jgi:hypothetical protein